MTFAIKEIEDKKTWEDFLLGCEEKTFLQSWGWGEFQKLMGNKIWRIGISEKDELIAICFFYKIAARRGTFLFLPHGPAITSVPDVLGADSGRKSKKLQVLTELTKILKEIAREEKIDFIRIAPIWERNEENIKFFKNLGFRQAPIHMHPELTWQLNILGTEDEILKGMRKTTRYLVNQGTKKKEVEIVKSKDEKVVEIFNELYQATVNRQHFTPFSLNYLKNELLAFSPDNEVLVFLAKHNNEILASAIFIFWQGIAFYHQGASTLAYPKIPASYLLQWEAIKEAKSRGCKLYNFWGIAESDLKDKSHPWWGLTLFKMGFGGEKKEYVTTQDLPLSKKYWFNFIVERIRKTKRGF